MYFPLFIKKISLEAKHYLHIDSKFDFFDAKSLIFNDKEQKISS